MTFQINKKQDEVKIIDFEIPGKRPVVYVNNVCIGELMED